MDVGLMIEGQEGVTWEQWVALARTCEEHGIGALFRSDHYNGLMGDETRDATDAWALIAALAAVTSTVRLGTLVSPVTFRHPSVLAKMVATADHVSGGRVELGLGAGWNEREHAAYGFEFPDLGTRFLLLEEQAEIIRAQFTSEQVDHAGSHYRLQGLSPLPRPVQSPVPLIIGGLGGPRSAALAARVADEYNHVMASVDDLPERQGRLDQACEDVGRDPGELTRSVMTGCVVGTDRDEVRARVERVMDKAGADGDPDDFAAERVGRWVIGTVDEVREQLARLGELGIERIMLQHLVHEDLDMVALIGDELVGA